jgi:hypothetical protein
MAEIETNQTYAKWRGCTNKKFFYTKKAARAAAVRRKKVFGVKPRVYECQYCACWHHTTKPQKDKE